MRASAIGFSSTAGEGEVKCIERERQALLAFKQGLVDKHNRLSSWGTGEDKKNCCKWKGVICSRKNGHVIRLDLQGDPINDDMRLEGNLSSPLFELRHLNHLDLSRNGFDGHIPESISSLHKLKHLDLSFNRFIGPIPNELGNLTSLKVLDLSKNEFGTTTNLVWVSCLSSLKRLVLSSNEFSGPVPSDQLANLSSLESLDLGYNKFDSVKNLEWLSHLSALNDLDLTDINLSKAVGWQQVVHKLPILSQLVLSNCSLQDVLQPSVPMVNTSTSHAASDVGAGNLNVSIFELLLKYRHSLVWLDLSVNHLQGPIPEAFGNMTSLENLYLSGNLLKGGIPKSFGNLCRLGYLSLADNDLEGMLPELIGNLSGCLQSSLENFDMRGNKVMGRLPNLIAEFSSLWSLELSNNKLSGPLTKSIGRMSNLRHLHVGSNNFSGVITEEHFLNLSTLRSLNLSFNNLSINVSHDWNPPFQLDSIDLSSCLLGPEFPKWIKTQSEFSLLHLSHCGISGNIPEWFWYQSSRMEGIDLSSNNLSGTLPDLSEKFQGSPGIDLSSNKFEGPLPLFPAKAKYIDLSNNTFSGPISSICAISGGVLEFLDLSNNNLSGVLPDCFNWPMLIVLKLANNHFSGEIPSSVGSLSWLESVSLRNNNLFGEIPQSLGNCDYLQFVDLSHNMFSGMIPYWIGDMLPNITYLLLRSNNFHGAIPSQLCQLKNIFLLDFSNNSLSGSIPRCIHQMSALARNEVSSVDGHVIFTSADSENFGDTGIYRDKTSLLWKGVEYEIPDLKDRRIIDFSSNNLSGSIPDLMWSLVGLV